MPDHSAADNLNNLMSGYWHTQAIYVAAKLGIAELLKDGPRTTYELRGTERRGHSLALPAAARGERAWASSPRTSSVGSH